MKEALRPAFAHFSRNFSFLFRTNSSARPPPSARKKGKWPFNSQCQYFFTRNQYRVAWTGNLDGIDSSFEAISGWFLVIHPQAPDSPTRVPKS